MVVVRATRINWREQAACLDTDPELFFPVGTTGPALDSIEQARQICRACPVQPACLDWALHHGADQGVWGGMDEQQRATLRRRRRAGLDRPITTPIASRPSRYRAVSRGDVYRQIR